MTGTLAVSVLVTWLAGLRTPSLPRWAHRLALAIFVGALAQAPLGYLAVKTDLRWPVVAAHLLLSALLLAGAVVLALEAHRIARGGSEPVVPLELRRAGLVVAGAALALLVTGTLAIGPFSFPWSRLVVIAAAALIFVVFWIFMQRTRLGRAMGAQAETFAGVGEADLCVAGFGRAELAGVFDLHPDGIRNRRGADEDLAAVG